MMAAGCLLRPTQAKTTGTTPAHVLCVEVKAGRTIALASTGRVGGAGRQRRLFWQAAARVPPTRTVFSGTCMDVLEVAGAMLEGELDYRRGRLGRAFASLRRAIELDDALPDRDLWGWAQPARHAYGALLLEQGKVAEAEAVYRADLGLDDTAPRVNQHPGNVWSLHGYHECLTRLAKHDAARIVRQQLHLATAHADVPIQASCACRCG